ncbi:hypothetical protein [Cytobacillus firmus]|uniref:hypothetical protein n=1 Tax=Cytobacillus firmus TaxID=1399 RepID=UPI0018CD7C68|nr:hypothetical protein [Cytobacillus firmus]MED1907844.1 hypothetical protein [Cytobacillus firmus]
MKDQLTEIKLNIKRGRLRLRDIEWLVKTVEQQEVELQQLRTVDKACQAMKKAL